MGFCTKCGKELIEGAAFCVDCGAAVEAAEPEKVEQAEAEQVLESQVYPAEPVSATDHSGQYAEEKECLDNYYKLLKWERVSWSIAGKVYLIIGIIFGAFMSLFLLLGIAEGEPALILFSILYIAMFIGMFLAIGIINLKMVKKTQYYMDTLYTDIRPTVERCGSVGMIVFECIFGAMSPVFFIINFARTKGNKHITDRIIAHQQEGK